MPAIISFATLQEPRFPISTATSPLSMPRMQAMQASITKIAFSTNIRYGSRKPGNSA